MEIENVEVIDEYFFRRPVISIDEFLDKVNRLENNNDGSHILLDNDEFFEAVLLSSPSTIQALDNKKTSIKLEETLFNFFSRACFRPTPYGLFSGIGKGRLVQENIKFMEKQSKIKFVSIDNAVFSNIVETVIQNEIEKLCIRKNICTTKNGNYYVLRTESHKSNAKVMRSNSLLDYIFDNCQEEIFVEKLCEKIHKKFQISSYNSKNLIIQLIQQNFLITNLVVQKPYNDYLSQLILSLKNIKSDYYYMLDTIDKQIKKYESSSIGDYESLLTFRDFLWKSLNISSDFSVNTDLKYMNECMDVNIKTEILDAYYILQSLTIPSIFSNATQNICKFFLQNFDIGDEIPLLDFIYSEKAKNSLDFIIPDNNESDNIRYQKQEILSNIIDFAILNKETVVELSSDVIKKLYSIYNSENNCQFTSIVMSSLSSKTSISKEFFLNPYLIGSYPMNLMGRFLYMFDEIDLMNICREERKDVIFAEISSLSPKSELNNVGISKNFLSSEICINTKSSVNSINISDILVCLDNNLEVYLKDRRSGKQVIPAIHSMQNINFFSKIEKFLMLFSKREEYFLDSLFDFGLESRVFSPRIKYKNITIFKARYKLSFSILNIDEKCDLNSFENAIKKWKKELNVPNIVGFEEFGETQYYLLTYPVSLRILFRILKSKKNIIVTELGFDLDCLNSNSSFITEYIFNVKNNKIKFLEDTSSKREEICSVRQVDKFTFYIKFYIAEELANEFLATVLLPMIKQYNFQKYFIIKYRDPDFHIRFRVMGVPIEEQASIYAKLLRYIQTDTLPVQIDNYIIDTFTPEINRYGGIKLSSFVYEYFCHESVLYLNLLAKLVSKQIAKNEYIRSMFGILIQIIFVFFKNIDNFSQTCYFGSQIKNNQKIQRLYDEIFYSRKEIVVCKTLKRYLDKISGFCINNQQKQELASSIMHMTINRFNSDIGLSEDEINYLLIKYIKYLYYTQQW